MYSYAHWLRWGRKKGGDWVSPPRSRPFGREVPDTPPDSVVYAVEDVSMFHGDDDLIQWHCNLPPFLEFHVVSLMFPYRNDGLK